MNRGTGVTTIVQTVAYLGLEARGVEVQVQLIAGLPAFNVVGLGDKAVGESRERVRGAIAAMGLALPPKRIAVNLSPADLPKEGSHFDLPIALAPARRDGGGRCRDAGGTMSSSANSGLDGRRRVFEPGRAARRDARRRARAQGAGVSGGARVRGRVGGARSR